MWDGMIGVRSKGVWDGRGRSEGIWDGMTGVRVCGSKGVWEWGCVRVRVCGSGDV